MLFFIKLNKPIKYKICKKSNIFETRRDEIILIKIPPFNPDCELKLSLAICTFLK